MRIEVNGGLVSVLTIPEYAAFIGVKPNTMAMRLAYHNKTGGSIKPVAIVGGTALYAVSDLSKLNKEK